MSIKIASHATSNIGRVRASNQDSGYAGYQLFFVADGMGGHAGGDIASALASQRIAHVDNNFAAAEPARIALTEAVLDANRVLQTTVDAHVELAGMGTTFSGMLFVDNQAVVGHIGDSRIYLAREGEVRQITSDHTFVQRLVDTGRITPEEALVHPRRSVLMRVLGDVEETPTLDTQIIETMPGDRWLLCSDGLSGFVPDEIVNRLLTSKTDAFEASELLVGEALEYGAPDNVTVVVVDILDQATKTEHVPTARFVGSAANDVVIDERKGRKLLRLLNPRLLPELLGRRNDEAAFAPESDEYLDFILNQTMSKIRARRWRQALTYLLLAGLVVGLGFGAYSYTQTRYYVGVSNQHVTIYKGIKESMGPFKFSKIFTETEIKIDQLPEYQKQLVERTIGVASIEEAGRVVQTLRDAVVND